MTRCVQDGYRVVELDCYDKGAECIPIVTHGGTLTSAITFQECVATIAEHGFATSDYPIILTLENHCTEVIVFRCGARIFPAEASCSSL